jgi:hypothetical protein
MDPFGANTEDLEGRVKASRHFVGRSFLGGKAVYVTMQDGRPSNESR